MKARWIRFELGILFGFGLASLVLLGAVLLWEWKYPLPYRAPEPLTQPSTSPASLGELTTRVENLENDQTYNLKVLEWKLDQKLLLLGWMGLFISFAAGFLGVKTYNDLDKVIKEKVNASLEKALYQLDPTYLPIHIYKGRVRRSIQQGETPCSAARASLPNVKRRLTLTGLLNVGEIAYLDKVTQTGITVIPIDDEADEEEFIKFIQDRKGKLDPEEAGFILYAPSGYIIKKAQNAFENTTIANMPATVASMVLVVGRGLKNREGISIKQEATQ
jgi:hypothetical protein